MSIKKILVTGSSGTVGTRLCESLLEKNYGVVGADLKPNRWNKDINKLTKIVDLTNSHEVNNNLPKNLDMVVHLAANARVYDLVVSPRLAKENLDSLFNMLEFSRECSIKRFIFSSSREVYGNSDKIVHTEDEAYVKNCESPYTASKIAGEALVHSYKQCYDLDFIIFRLSNVYGMYDNSDRVIPLFIKRCREGKDLIVYGKDKKLDFTYIDDAVSGIVSGIERFDEVKNDVYNLGCGEGTSLEEVAYSIKKYFPTNSINVIAESSRRGEVIRYIADISKARAKLDYKPTIPIIEGLKKSVEWYKRNLD